MSTNHNLNTAPILDAIRNMQNETSAWVLADALAAEIPSGMTGLAQILDEAKGLGIAGKKLTVNTLRLYRDSANRWPAADRVENVSFSAHRAAMVLEKAEAKKLLETLAATLGAANVTVAQVRDAVAAKRGTPTKMPTAAAVSANQSMNPNQGQQGPAWQTMAIADLTHNTGADLVGAITDTTDLDALHRGLTAVLTAVESAKAKAARKAKATKAPTTTETTESDDPGAKTTRPRTRKAPNATGDIRGL